MGWISKGLLIFLALLIVLSLFPLKLHVRLYREPNHLEVSGRLYLWLLPVGISLVNPMTSMVYKMSTNQFWLQTAPRDLRAQDVAWRRLIARMNLFHQVLLPIYRMVNSFFHRICRPIKIKKLFLYTEIGLEDAAQTAIAVGLIWGWKGFIYSRLAHLFNTQGAENCLNVVPNYQQPGYVRIDYSCIFEFRLGHIIIMIYHVLRSIGEIRELLRRVSQ